MKKSFITVDLNTKPHIAHFLKVNYGSPCTIPAGNFISKYLNSLLEKSDTNDERNYKFNATPIKIKITKTILFRNGHKLTATAEHNFTVAVNNYIKTQIRTIAESIFNTQCVNDDWMNKYIELQKEHKQLLKILSSRMSASTTIKNKTFEASLNKRITEFNSKKILMQDALKIAAYQRLGFNETVLPFETIKKDYYRYKNAVSN